MHCQQETRCRGTHLFGQPIFYLKFAAFFSGLLKILLVLILTVGGSNLVRARAACEASSHPLAGQVYIWRTLDIHCYPAFLRHMGTAGVGLEIAGRYHGRERARDTASQKQKHMVFWVGIISSKKQSGTLFSF